MLATVDLRFYYPYGPKILEGFSESFARGELVSITGASGQGKSTLLYLLGLMLQPISGHVVLDGVSVANLSDRQRARLRAHRFGFVFQDAALDSSRSVLDNVSEAALYRGENPKKVEMTALSLLEQFGVRLRATARPGEVSGGQAQRIALARALLHNPLVLLCDEPTGNLDQTSARIVLDALRAHAQAGSIVIIVTHDESVVQSCDREVRL